MSVFYTTKFVQAWTYLDHLQRPCLDVPLALRDTSNVIVNKKAFGLDFEDQTIGDLAYTRNKLRYRLWKQVIEEIDSLDDNLVGISGRVWSSL